MKKIISFMIACIIAAMLCGCAGTKYLPISLEKEKQELELAETLAYTDVVVPVTYAILKGESLLSDTICNNGLKDVPTYLYNPKVIDKNNLEDLVIVGFYTHKEVFS